MSKDELPGAGSSAKWAAIAGDRLIPLSSCATSDCSNGTSSGNEEASVLMLYSSRARAWQSAGWASHQAGRE